MYFKITNEKENHHGLQYQDGLVEDIVPFNNNPENSCCSGGIYFSDEKNVLKFSDYGPWIRLVDIPKDANFVHDSSGDKWRANKVFFHPRKKLWEIETIQWLIDNKVNIHVGAEKLLQVACAKGYIDIVKFLIEKNAYIHAENDSPLRYSIQFDKFEISKYLIEKGANVNAQDDICLLLTIRNGHFEMFKYLVEKGACLNTRDSFPIRLAAHHGQLEMIKFLVENGVDIHSHYNPALRLAKENGNQDVINYIESLN